MSHWIPALVCAFVALVWACAACSPRSGAPRGRSAFCAVCFAVAAILWMVNP